MRGFWKVGEGAKSHMRSPLLGLVLEEAPWSDGISALGQGKWTEQMLSGSID